MIEALLLLAQTSVLKIASSTCIAPAGTYVWEIEYADGEFQTFTTTDGRLTWVPIPHRDWRARNSFNGGPQSGWSDWHPGEIFLGDADGDCIVGAPDVREIGLRWGMRCP